MHSCTPIWRHVSRPFHQTSYQNPASKPPRVADVNTVCESDTGLSYLVMKHEGADTVQPCCHPRTDQPKERKKGNVLMQSGLFQLLTQAFKLFNTGATVADAAVKAIKYLKKERKTERVDSNQTRQSQQELLSPSKMLFFSCFWLVYCYKKMTPFRMKMSHLLWCPCLFLIMHSHFLKSKGL